MKIKCPHCGEKGTDDAPYNVGEPIRRESQKQYAFEVRGNYTGRPVRKCLKCGKGVRVTFLPPRFKKVSDEEWDYLQEQWVLFQEQMERGRERTEREYE
jgi:rRNA maturation protein Nop10